MAGSAQGPDQLVVCLDGPVAYVHVRGRGSYKIGIPLKQFGMAALDAQCARLVVDMSECLGMDSTFMGVLAGLAFRLRQKANGEIHMVNLTPRTRGMLATLGLDQVIRPYMAGATPDEYRRVLAGCNGMAVLGPTEVSRAATASTMLEAHEELVRMNPENLPRFKDVLTFLREDLRKEEGEGRPS